LQLLAGPGGAYFITRFARERDLRSFLEEPSYSGGTALGAGVFIVTSPSASGTRIAIEAGVGTPQAGVSGGTSFFVGKETVGW
jgi:hypothetical protein